MNLLLGWCERMIRGMSPLTSHRLDACLDNLTCTIQEAKRRASVDRRALNEHSLLTALKATHDCNESPMWVKDLEGRMLYLNQAYLSQFDVDGSSYPGVRDTALWPASVACAFGLNDMKVKEEKRTIVFVEDVPINGELIPYRIKKWPVMLDGVLLGVAGESLGPVDAGDR